MPDHRRLDVDALGAWLPTGSAIVDDGTEPTPFASRAGESRLHG